MNGTTNSNEALVRTLCPVCGLCCNGVIFADVRLQPADDAGRLRSLGLPVGRSHATARPVRLAQPCAAFDGCRCRVYSERPRHCVEFDCLLLKNVKAGRLTEAAALCLIREARKRADAVHTLLRELNDADEDRALSVRFKRTRKRLETTNLDDDIADRYGRLTLAVHDLNLLIQDAFYPG